MSLITNTAVHAIANAAAWLVSCRRELVRHALTFEECEAAGLPEGSTERAVHVQRPTGALWWRLDAWLDSSADGSPSRAGGAEGCLHVDALGYSIEVYYYRRPQVATRAAR